MQLSLVGMEAAALTQSCVSPKIADQKVLWIGTNFSGHIIIVLC